MPTAEQLQKLIRDLFPGLMGVEIGEVAQDKIVAGMLVRPDLCTTGGVCHGGALMAFADTVGAIGTVMNLPAGARTTTIEFEDQLHGPGAGRHAHHGRVGPAAPGPDHAGVADLHQVGGRQAGRRRHSDADGAAEVLTRLPGSMRSSSRSFRNSWCRRTRPTWPASTSRRT